MGKKSFALIACILLLVAGGLYYFLKDDGEEKIQPKAPQSQQTSGMVYSGNSLVEEKDGKRLWELSADTIEVNPDTNIAQLANVKGIFYQANGGKIELTALQGFYDTTAKVVTVTGQVKAVSSDGATFSAAEARWMAADRRLYGTGGVTVTRDDTVIVGDRLESDSNMEKIKVIGNARVMKGGTAN